MILNDLYNQSSINVEKIANVIITSALFTNAAEWILKLDINQAITILLGIGSIPLLIYKLINGYNSSKKSKLDREDAELHVKREQLEIELLRKKIDALKSKKTKQKSNITKG